MLYFNPICKVLPFCYIINIKVINEIVCFFKTQSLQNTEYILPLLYISVWTSHSLSAQWPQVARGCCIG